jgi:hypothetical protein
LNDLAENEVLPLIEKRKTITAQNKTLRTSFRADATTPFELSILILGENNNFNDIAFLEFLLTSPEPAICDIKDKKPIYQKNINENEKIRNETYQIYR